jgi:hypothetical protein
MLCIPVKLYRFEPGFVHAFMEEANSMLLAGVRLDHYGLGGKTPWSAMMKFRPRYGCMLLCGCPPPAELRLAG